MHPTPEIIAQAKEIYVMMIAKDSSPENVAKAERLLRDTVGKANYEEIKSEIIKQAEEVHKETTAQDMESPYTAASAAQDQDNQIGLAGEVDSQTQAE